MILFRFYDVLKVLWDRGPWLCAVSWDMWPLEDSAVTRMSHRRVCTGLANIAYPLL